MLLWQQTLAPSILPNPANLLAEDRSVGSCCLQVRPPSSSRLGFFVNAQFLPGKLPLPRHALGKASLKEQGPNPCFRLQLPPNRSLRNDRQTVLELETLKPHMFLKNYIAITEKKEKQFEANTKEQPIVHVEAESTPSLLQGARRSRDLFLLQIRLRDAQEGKFDSR